MKKHFIFPAAFLLILLSTSVFAQSTNWADYGLTEEDVQYLSEEERAAILSAPTPSQTNENLKASGESSGIPLVPGFGDIDKNIQSSDPNPEAQSCFDLYTFGSVQADMTSQSSDTVAGVNMEFSGTIENSNAYPIVEGTLYVKIFKKNGDEDEKNPNGPDVVAQFVALDNLTIPAHGFIPATFSWKVPAYAQSGDYQLTTFFTADKKFNLLGLSFTDDIIGNVFNFSVDGEQTGVSFDKSSVVINENPYYFAAYPPRISQGDTVRASISVDNTTGVSQQSKIKWSLYKWDAMNPDNLVRSFVTETNVEANSSATINLDISEKDAPVYYLVGELQYQDSQSIVGIRFVREGVDKVRLNFPSVTTYPLVKDQQATVFTCLHNSGTSTEVPNNKVVLEIKDAKGRIVESYTYEGVVTGEMMAIKKDFVSKVNLDVFSVHAAIYTDDKLVDESVMEYDCKLINPDSCQEKSFLQNILSIVGLVVVLVILIIATLFIKKFKMKKDIILPLFLLLACCGLMSTPHISEAKSATYNKVESKIYNYFVNFGEGDVVINGQVLDSSDYGGTGWGKGLANPNITVTYNTEIRDTTTGALINDGAIVPVGTKLNLKFLKHVTNDVYWFGTGFSSDSPYGEWRADAAPPAESCVEKDYVTTTSDTNGALTGHLGVYIPLVVNPPQKTLSGTSGMACSALTGNEASGYSADCTVTQPGTINPKFTFAPTTGKFYYRYKIIDFIYKGTNYTSQVANTCVANNIPMQDNSTKSSYTLAVPQKDILHTFSAIATTTGNQPPLPPVISGPTVGSLTTSYPFGFVATDPDGDTVKYAIDWNNDGAADQWLPGTDYVASGVAQNSSKSWSALGSYTFKAKTYDQYGLSSGWASHTITLSLSTLACEGTDEECGRSSGDGFSCSTNGSIKVNTTATFTAKPSAADGYAWYADKQLLQVIGNSYQYKEAFTRTGTYTRWVKITEDGTDHVKSCTARVDCGPRPSSANETACINGKQKVYMCTSTGWELTELNCGEGTGTDAVVSQFYFSPNIVPINDSCPLYLDATNASSCTLTKTGSVSSMLTYTAIDGMIKYSGEEKIPVGTYTLSCTGIGLEATTSEFGTKLCVSSPDIKEQ